MSTENETKDVDPKDQNADPNSDANSTKDTESVSDKTARLSRQMTQHLKKNPDEVANLDLSS